MYTDALKIRKKKKIREFCGTMSESRDFREVTAFTFLN